MLNSHGLGLPCVGIPLDHTVGGAVCAARHGSSVHAGSIASLVLELQLVLASGKVCAVGMTRSGVYVRVNAAASYKRARPVGKMAKH